MEATRPVVDLPVEGSLPPLSGATGWLNSPPVTAADLGGHAVLVNFWTYTCINWLRQLPYLRAWSEKYQDQGLIVLGVHTPEFDVEHDLDNLRRAATDLRSTIRSRSTTTTRSGMPSATATGRPCTSSTRKGRSGIIVSARATTSAQKRPCNGC
jgi:thiol-disulfide isomerase/thioredoxin